MILELLRLHAWQKQSRAAPWKSCSVRCLKRHGANQAQIELIDEQTKLRTFQRKEIEYDGNNRRRAACRLFDVFMDQSADFWGARLGLASEA